MEMNREKIERLKALLALQAESYDTDDQHAIAQHVIDVYHSLSEGPELEIIGDDFGNVYITKGPPSPEGLYPCVVAHLDQVHKKADGYREIHEDGDVIFALGKSITGDYQQVGTGSDDLTGVWLCLELLLSLPSLKVAFFVDEEVGCQGSADSDVSFFKDCSFVLQGDRRSDTNDFITYTNGVNVSSKEFKKATKPILTEFKYRQTSGIATDVGQLIINGIGCCAANVSCGYFNEHTKRETSSISLSLNCLNLMTKLIKELSYKRWPMPKQTRKPKLTVVVGDNKASAEVVVSQNQDPFFEGMPMPSKEECKYKGEWIDYRITWIVWAEKFFKETYGKSRQVLAVPDPYRLKYDVDSFHGPAGFLVDLYAWKAANPIPKKEAKLGDSVLLECMQCELWGTTSFLKLRSESDYNKRYYCSVCKSETTVFKK